MRIRSKLLQNIIIIYFMLYIILGNAARLINIKGAGDNLSLTEIILFIFVAVLIIYNYKDIKNLAIRYKELVLFSVVFILFSIFGVIYHRGEYIKAFLYAIRTVMLIASTFVFASAIYEKYRNNFLKVINLIVVTFFAYTILGWSMLIMFPKSQLLWAKLAEFGIHFGGDPHINRFMGTLFDPNYASSIFILPVLMCIYVYFNYNSIKYNWLYLVGMFYFLGCMLATYSRSGVLGFGISCVIIFGVYVYNIVNKKETLEKKSIYFGAISLGVGILAFIVKSESIFRMLSRFNNIFDDPSAQHRFKDFFTGIKHAFSSIYVSLFGIGYNYVQHDLGLSLGALDSSIINTIVCFGIIGTALLLYFIYKYMVKVITNYKIIEPKFVKYLIAYTVSALVICNFNNLLYYQFFIIVFFSLLNYGYIYNKSTKE